MQIPGQQVLHFHTASCCTGETWY